MRIGYSQGTLSRLTLMLSAAAAVALAYLQTALLGAGIIS